MKLRFLMAPEGEAPVTTPPPAAPPAAAPPAAPPEQKGTLITDAVDGQGKPTDASPTDIKITVPEGFTVDQKRLDGFVAFARENKISQEGAQKFFDAFVQQQKDDAQAAQLRQAEQVTQWAEESRKEFGKDFDATIVDAKKALQRFGTPELQKLLTQSGLGNHKDVIRFLSQVGQKIAEDKLPAKDGAPVKEQTSAEDRLKSLYDKSPQMQF